MAPVSERRHVVMVSWWSSVSSFITDAVWKRVESIAHEAYSASSPFSAGTLVEQISTDEKSLSPVAFL